MKRLGEPGYVSLPGETWQGPARGLGLESLEGAKVLLLGT